MITIPNLNKKLVYAASFSALYIILAYLVTFVTGPSLRGSDAHLIRALLIVILASRFKTPGSATLMGIISGFILLGVPAPASFLYLPGSILAGLTYDLFMSIGNYSKNSNQPPSGKNNNNSNTASPGNYGMLSLGIIAIIIILSVWNSRSN